MTNSEQRAVLDIIAKLEERAVGGDYIFRGEPADFGKVSSGFYREYVMGTGMRWFPMGDGDIDDWSTQISKKALSWKQNDDEAEEQIFPITRAKWDNGKLSLFAPKDGRPSEEEKEAISEMQHYGGITNVIDFTLDFLIALFFACDGSDYSDRAGRVILLSQAHAKDMGEKIWTPRKVAERATPQKSIFVQPKNGYIDLKDAPKPIPIPKNLKKPILDHLKEAHGLHAKYIFSGVLGFIRSQKLHKKEVEEAFLRRAIEVCTEMKDYGLRGRARALLGEFVEAISDHKMDIKLNPKSAESYFNCAIVYSQIADIGPDFSLSKYKLPENGFRWLRLAKAHFSMAIQNNPNWVGAYIKRGLCHYLMGNSNKGMEKDFACACDINFEEASSQLLFLGFTMERDKSLQKIDLTEVSPSNAP